MIQLPFRMIFLATIRYRYLVFRNYATIEQFLKPCCPHSHHLSMLLKAEFYEPSIIKIFGDGLCHKIAGIKSPSKNFKKISIFFASHSLVSLLKIWFSKT